jgi:hypothetical protein
MIAVIWVVTIAFCVAAVLWAYKMRRNAKARKHIAAGMAGDLAGEDVSAGFADADGGDGGSGGGDGGDGD